MSLNRHNTHILYIRLRHLEKTFDLSLRSVTDSLKSLEGYYVCGDETYFHNLLFKCHNVVVITFFACKVFFVAINSILWNFLFFVINYLKMKSRCCFKSAIKIREILLTYLLSFEFFVPLLWKRISVEYSFSSLN